MRTIWISILTLIATCSYSQEFITTGVFTPNSFVEFENYLYIFESTGNKISKFNLENVGIVNTPEDFITGLNNPNSGRLKDSILYFCQQDRISKIDLANSNPFCEDILTGVNYPHALAIDNNDIYFRENYSVFKINLNDQNLTKQQVTSSNDSLYIIKDMIVLDNNLFIAVIDDNKLYRLNLENNSQILDTIATNLPNIQKLDIYNNELYSANSGGNGYIIKWNLEDENFVQEIILENVGKALSLLVQDDEIFVAKVNTFSVQDTIVKYSEITSNLNIIGKNRITFFPNPVNSILNIEVKEEIDHIEILTISGISVHKVKLNESQNTEIFVGDLTPGIYLLRNNRSILGKFIKI